MQNFVITPIQYTPVDWISPRHCVYTKWNKIPNEPQLRIGIIDEFEKDILGLLPRPGGFGWLRRMGGLVGSVGMGR